MCYVAGLPDNEKEHRRYHDCVVNGVPARPLKTDYLIWQEDDRRITLIRARSAIAQRKRAEKVARFANVEAHYSYGIYSANEPPEGRDYHNFLYHANKRIVGFIMLEKRQEIWRCRWRDDADYDCQRLDRHEAMWSIVFMWVLKSHRRQGMATRLLREALVYLSVPYTKVGYYTPFTDDGQEFVHRLNPAEFYVAK